METEAIRADLYEIITKYKKEEYPRLIEQRASYPYLYHLSAIRENLISWLPVTKEMRVLERNAEYGALTGRLLQMAGQVVSVTEEEAGAELIRARCQEAGERLTVLTERAWVKRRDAAVRPPAPGRGSRTGDTENGFDRILIVGHTSGYMWELKELCAMLRPGGTLVLSDANRLGLKYLAGCQEEYRGGYFTGVEGYPSDSVSAGGKSGSTDDGKSAAGRYGAVQREGSADSAGMPRCYTRIEYIRLLSEAGFTDMRFYYPYPDHKFPSVIYSDDWLPKRGELKEQRRNFDRDRLLLLDEGRVYDTLMDEGLFGEFSNSFLIEAKSGRAE